MKHYPDVASVVSTLVLVMLIAAALAGCTALGLTDRNDRTPEFWRDLERQQGFASP